LGQQAPLDAKKTWDPDFAKRKKIQAILDKLIPEFAINLGGTTSVDVTKKGIDKKYGMFKLRDILGIQISDMIFIGDALFPGGNDYPAKESGAYSVLISGPDETKRVIEGIVGALDNGSFGQGFDKFNMIEVKKEGIILQKLNLDFENESVLNPAVMQAGNALH